MGAMAVAAAAASVAGAQAVHGVASESGDSHPGSLLAEELSQSSPMSSAWPSATASLAVIPECENSDPDPQGGLPVPTDGGGLWEAITQQISKGMESSYTGASMLDSLARSNPACSSSSLRTDAHQGYPLDDELSAA